MIGHCAIVFAFCAVLAATSATRSEEERPSGASRLMPAGVSAKVRLPPDSARGARTIEVDVIAALGRAWHEPELRGLLATLRIERPPNVRRGDDTTFLQNRKLGIELTFKYAEAMDVPLRDHPPGTLVLHNIRFYGPRSRPHDIFTGDLPFGLRFGDSKEALIAKLGPADLGPNDLGVMRWDTAGYALFATLDDYGTLFRLSLQTPYAATTRPGFEGR
jgi:hypothetical protein